MTSGGERVVVRRRFMRQLDDEDSERPLDRCLRWIDKQQQQQQRNGDDDDDDDDDDDLQYVVLSHESEAARREYEAVSEQELRRWATELASERHAHEVLVWPTKLYGDVDLPASPEAEQCFERALAALVRECERRFQVQCSPPVVMDASDARKFSRHFTVDMHRDGRAWRFASTVDCGNFVASVAEAEAVCDAAVYRAKNTLRMYGSTKLQDASRRFVPLGGDPAAPLEQLEWRTLVASLVTWPCVRDEQRLLRVGAAAAAASSKAMLVKPKRTRPLAASWDGGGQDTESVDGADELLERLTADIEPLEDVGGATGVRRSLRTGMLLVSTASHMCASKGAAHSSNTIFFLVDEQRRRYKQLCHSPKCSNSAARWRSFSGGGGGGGGGAGSQQCKRARTPPSTADGYPSRVCSDFLGLMKLPQDVAAADRLVAPAPV